MAQLKRNFLRYFRVIQVSLNVLRLGKNLFNISSFPWKGKGIGTRSQRQSMVSLESRAAEEHGQQNRNAAWQKTISGDNRKGLWKPDFQEVSVKILTLIQTQIPVLLFTLNNICSVSCYSGDISQISLKPPRWRCHQHELEIGISPN